MEEHICPVVMLEHRLLYELSHEEHATELLHPLFGSKLEREGTDPTIIATSVMVLEAKHAAEHLPDGGIEEENINPTRYPIPIMRSC